MTRLPPSASKDSVTSSNLHSSALTSVSLVDLCRRGQQAVQDRRRPTTSHSYAVRSYLVPVIMIQHAQVSPPPSRHHYHSCRGRRSLLHLHDDAAERQRLVDILSYVLEMQQGERRNEMVETTDHDDEDDDDNIQMDTNV